jgi:hypothetical protein
MIQGQEIIDGQYVIVFVKDMAIAPYGFLINFIVVAVGKDYLYSLFGSRNKGVMDGKQYIQRLGGTGLEQVPAQDDGRDIHFPANSNGFVPVGMEAGDVIF